MCGPWGAMLQEVPQQMEAWGEGVLGDRAWGPPAEGAGGPSASFPPCPPALTRRQWGG